MPRMRDESSPSPMELDRNKDVGFYADYESNSREKPRELNI